MTKSTEFESIINDLINYIYPYIKYYKKGNTQIMFGKKQVVYSQDIVGLEGFARLLYGLAPVLKYKEKYPKINEIYSKVLKGIKNGVDPNYKYHWKNVEDYDQTAVEMAAIAYFVLLNHKQLKNDLSKKTIEYLELWLSRISSVNTSKNNWQFFKVLCNGALKKLNSKYFNEEAMITALENNFKCYLDNGWYYDGRIGQRDYYITFGYHFYSMVFYKYFNNEYPKYTSIMKNRAIEFYSSIKHFFRKDGLNIPYGRSLIYRFAAGSFFSMLATLKFKEIDKGELKGYIISIHNFWKNQSIINNKGLLNLGFTQENHNFLEEYNSLNSPLWALKFYAFLMLESDDEFYKIETKSIKPFDEYASKEAGVIIKNINDELYMINAGMFAKFNPLFNVEKYTKNLYSTKYGFNFPKSNKYPNSTFGIETDEGIFWKRETDEYNLIFEDNKNKLISKFSICNIEFNAKYWFEDDKFKQEIWWEFNKNIKNVIFTSHPHDKKIKNKQIFTTKTCKKVSSKIQCVFAKYNINNSKNYVNIAIFKPKNQKNTIKVAEEI